MSIQDSRKVFSIGCWQVTPSSLTIDYEEHTHQLPAKVFQVLLLLVEAQGETVSHAKFYELVWQGNENVAKKLVPIIKVLKPEAILWAMADE